MSVGIIAAGLARKVDTWLSEGKTPTEAAMLGVQEVSRRGGDIGVIVVGPDTMASAADQPMAWAGRESGSTTWIGP